VSYDLKDMEYAKSVTTEYYCNGRKFATLAAARKYKKEKNSQYDYIKHRVYAWTTTVLTLREIRETK